MPRVYTKPKGLVAQIGNHGPASNDVPAEVPEAVAAECALDARLRVEGAAETPPARPDPPGSPLDETPGGISTVNGDVARALIAAADEIEELDRLEAAESASQRHPGGRKGVLAAIAARREEVNAGAMNRASTAQEEK